MHIEIDQSQRVEEARDTILAFSDGEKYAIQVPVSVKAAAREVLRAKRRDKGVANLRIFIACVYLLIERHLDRIEHITIDEEFTGKDGEIKATLLNYIRWSRPDFPSANVTIRRIGKKSGAHYVAYGVASGRREADRVITSEELLGFFRK
ncbi:MAG: hypothetical protein ACE5JL_07970 [Dehalococcoidia bacterium]